jgi:isopentenyl phosphate kinase
VSDAAGAAIYLKLGGALLTEKGARETPRLAVIRRLAGEVASGLPAAAGPVVLAHGSGSYAHVAVRESGFLERPGDGLAFARVAAAARRLDDLVVGALLDAGLPAVSVPGSLLARCRDGRVIAVRGDIVADLLAAGLLPVLYGDVAVDETLGGAVASTEALLAALPPHVPPCRIVLATDVDGVFSGDPRAPGAVPIAEITPQDWRWLAPHLSAGRPEVSDVSGAMAGKVRAMFDLVERYPAVEVRLISGLRTGAVAAALADEAGVGGTRIVRRR